ncbi:uncharacterized protein [Elaeis guineensis]|uniref:Proline-rich receptor-like protein kinase PERK2 n=1 Tax=Elaeis guineensis var. tenera TaxID=51953 RepID=A0A6I9RTQ7_ELAGV|nr:proline-rich receptor-like protein kinase PERK2 [Elaeis guineensis]
MEPRSLTPSLLLTLFLPHLLSAAVSSSSAPHPSPSPPSPSPPASPPPLPPPPFTPPKQLESDKPPFRGSPPRKTSPPRRRPSCSSGHRDCPQPQRSVARKSPSKPELNFGEKLGLLFVGVAAVLQVLFGTFLVYKRMQLKKVQRREHRDMASSSGLST